VFVSVVLSDISFWKIKITKRSWCLFEGIPASLSCKKTRIIATVRVHVAVFILHTYCTDVEKSRNLLFQIDDLALTVCVAVHKMCYSRKKIPK